MTTIDDALSYMRSPAEIAEKLSKAVSSPAISTTVPVETPSERKAREAIERRAAMAGSAPVKVPLINSEGLMTGEKKEISEDLGLLISPDPVGHFMLVALPEIEHTNENGDAVTAGGIILPATVTDRERAASVVGTVLAMGPDCYKDPEPVFPEWLKELMIAGTYNGSVTMMAPRPRFPGGPWCTVGQTVLFSRYAGKRFKIEGIEFRMLADDEITATIPDGAQVGGL